MAKLKFKNPKTGGWEEIGGSTNDYTAADKAKVDAIPADPKYTDTTYTAGDGININSNNVISATANIEIAQTAGGSTAAVMSQKAVTDYIDSIRLSVSEPTDGNLVINSLGVAPIAYSNEMTAVETVKCTYSGTADASAVWATSSANKNIMVKVGEYTSGSVNAIGQTIKGVRRDSTWFSWETTVTDAMVDDTVAGIYQIKYQNVKDGVQKETVPITRAVVITTAGSYSIQHDGWTDLTTFPQKGIYFLDTEAIGGQDYTSELSIEITTSNGGGGSVDTPEEVTPITYKGKEIEVFTHGICIGDSITEGTFNFSKPVQDKNSVTINKYAYPRVLQKISGISISNAGIAGVTSAEWLAAADDSSTYWGTWDENQEWKWQTSTSAISFDGFDFAIIHLGINDCLNGVTVDAFETSMKAIIAKLQTAVSGIRIFVCTITPAYSRGNANMTAFNEKIKSIVQTYTENVYLIDLARYSECVGGTAYVNQHLTALGYSKMAQELYAMISYLMNQDLSKFNDVQFIGTSYEV